ncbi:hypothetical protein ACWGVR_23320 [Streptomyces xanthophaeus]
MPGLSVRRTPEADVSGVEGLVIKPLNSKYIPNYRGWTKIRRRDTSEAIVGAITGTLTCPQLLVQGRHDDTGRLRTVVRTVALRPEQARQVAERLTTADPGHLWTGAESRVRISRRLRGGGQGDAGSEAEAHRACGGADLLGVGLFLEGAEQHHDGPGSVAGQQLQPGIGDGVQEYAEEVFVIHVHDGTTPRHGRRSPVGARGRGQGPVPLPGSGCQCPSVAS